MELKLDAAALKALFPEGTEAHLNLQKAVIAEFVKKSFAAKNAVPEMVAQAVEHAITVHSTLLAQAIESIKQVEATKALHEEGVTQLVGGGTTFARKVLHLTQDTKDRIRSEVRTAFDDAVREQIKTTMEAVVKGVPQRVKDWEDYIDAEIRKQMNGVVMSKLMEAMKGGV